MPLIVSAETVEDDLERTRNAYRFRLRIGANHTAPRWREWGGAGVTVSFGRRLRRAVIPCREPKPLPAPVAPSRRFRGSVHHCGAESLRGGGFCEARQVERRMLGQVGTKARRRWGTR